MPAFPLAEEVRPLLRTRCFGQTMRGFRSVGSTNTVAAEWAAAEALEGSVVVADYQTAGRGRHGRTWEADAGQNLTFSLILRPTLPTSLLSLITLTASVAIAETVEAFATPHTAAIKWPNDVLLDGVKCCGVLPESTLGGSEGAVVILGVGLNVNQRVFPEALEDRATSLLLQTGQHTPRAPLFADLLYRLEQHYTSLGLDDGADARRAYEARLHGLGQPTTLRFAGRPQAVTGIALGITDTGALRLQTDGGIATFHAGEVSSQPL